MLSTCQRHIPRINTSLSPSQNPKTQPFGKKPFFEGKNHPESCCFLYYVYYSTVRCSSSRKITERHELIVLDVNTIDRITIVELEATGFGVFGRAWNALSCPPVFAKNIFDMLAKIAHYDTIAVSASSMRTASNIKYTGPS